MKKYLKFIGLVFITILVTYFSSKMVSTVWYLLILIMYSRSEDESFWLVFFFVTTDGFMGFFGMYATVLELLPGLPGIELVQFYLIISLVKVLRKKRKPNLFYAAWLKILLGYVIFLLLFGLANGLKNELNIQFKLVKMILPLLMFYTIPRLFTKLSDYQKLFNYLFLVTICAFIAQMITLFTGYDPQLHFGAIADTEMEMEIEVGRNFRVFYNSSVTLISLFGALYFLTISQLQFFKKYILLIVIISSVGLAFLSATRGWIIFFGFILFMIFIFVLKARLKQIFLFLSLFAVLLIVGLSIPKVNKQIHFSLDRLFTLNSLISGDRSAQGTLIRLTERSPKVLKIWEKSPVFGQGFSDVYFENSDTHVGNQNVLMHAGILGSAFLLFFILYFIIKMLLHYLYSSKESTFNSTYLVFIYFLIGWLFLHSTSGQQFGFYGLPNNIIPQAIFLSLAGLTYLGFNKRVVT